MLNCKYIQPLTGSEITMTGIPSITGKSLGISYNLVTDVLTTTMAATSGNLPYTYYELFPTLKSSPITIVGSREKHIISGIIFMECVENVVIQIRRYVNGVWINETNGGDSLTLTTLDNHITPYWTNENSSTPVNMSFSVIDMYTPAIGSTVEYRFFWASGHTSAITVTLNRSIQVPQNGNEQGISMICVERISK